MRYFQNEIQKLKKYQKEKGEIEPNTIYKFAEEKGIDVNIDKNFSVSEIIGPDLIKEFTRYIS